VIKLQLLLRGPYRDPHGVERVCRAAAAAGLTVTGAGRVTVSAEVSPEAFATLFGPPAAAKDAAPSPSMELPVPRELSEFVESITVAPRHVRMSPKNGE
jgi:hypothetical protein